MEKTKFGGEFYGKPQGFFRDLLNWEEQQSYQSVHQQTQELRDAVVSPLENTVSETEQ